MPTTRKLSNLSITEIEARQADASVKFDDGCDHTQRIIWNMNGKRYMRNGQNVSRPPAPQVAPVRVAPKKKPRKRVYRVVEKAIGAV
ncbi:hypothetical protein O3W44_02390 [Pantoea sp. LMR881]|uniref:hypothetical protein n=1 Tax=Pantoea sp. LMR881 TaxID=3014336 RepID=UPI0022B068FD|nr:hypothetical protein [Pantoea sp. LMR881]MCZ4058187.1 hypothetical protein [Pantoea sp. LMR881]